MQSPPVAAALESGARRSSSGRIRACTSSRTELPLKVSRVADRCMLSRIQESLTRDLKLNSCVG